MLRQNAAMHATGIPPEVLDHILGMVYSDRDLARCARVCKNWEHPALRHLWREMPPVHALFSLLGTLSAIDPQPLVRISIIVHAPYRSDITLIRLQEFEDQPDVSAWERFQRYASMIRSITLALGTTPEEEDMEHYNHVSKAAFQEVMFIAIAMDQNMFPFAREINIIVLDTESAKLSASLVHCGLLRLHLDWTYVPARSIGPMLKRIETKSRVNELDVLFDARDDTVPGVLPLLGDALNRLHALEKLQLQSFVMFDQHVWENIRDLSSLRNIYSRPAYGEQYPTPELGFSGGFPVLTEFRCALSYATALRLFSSPTTKPQFQDISILVYEPSASNTQALLTEIARIAPDLRRFSMGFTQPQPALAHEVFVPILQLTSISSLILCMDIQLTDESFQLIVDAVPNLEVLSICPNTTSEPTKPLTTLRALDCIGRRCTSIREIHIYLDASKGELPNYDTKLGQLPETLRNLNFGLSICNNTLATALQLMRMLRRCHPCIRSSRNYELYHDNEHPSVWKKYADAERRWRQVAEFIGQLRPFVNSVTKTTTEYSDRSDVDKDTAMGESP